MVNLGALENLEILSMGRNNIKKLDGLDAIGDVSTSLTHLLFWTLPFYRFTNNHVM